MPMSAVTTFWTCWNTSKATSCGSTALSARESNPLLSTSKCWQKTVARFHITVHNARKKRSSRTLGYVRPSNCKRFRTNRQQNLRRPSYCQQPIGMCILGPQLRLNTLTSALSKRLPMVSSLTRLLIHLWVRFSMAWWFRMLRHALWRMADAPSTIMRVLRMEMLKSTTLSMTFIHRMNTLVAENHTRQATQA
jgi:hypothetical protein